METPFQVATRLLAALEEFVAQESNLLRAQDFLAAVAVQQRAAPLIEELAAQAVDPAVASLQPRVAALIERRRQNSDYLEAELTRLKEALRRVDEARARLALVTPAYAGSGRPHVSRFNTAA